jgi:hypothetical protein
MPAANDKRSFTFLPDRGVAMHFKDVITDAAQFRELMGESPPPCVAKTIASLDRHCRAFIGRSPFVLPVMSRG